jgi:hypothetical protein
MTKTLLGVAMAALLLSVSACSTPSQYPGILQTTMAQALPPYHSVNSPGGPN